MIIRLWHGWTTPKNADIYENLLKTEIFPGIAAKGVAGYRGIRLLRRARDEEIEFITMMEFDSWEAIKKFAGSVAGKVRWVSGLVLLLPGLRLLASQRN